MVPVLLTAETAETDAKRAEWKALAAQITALSAQTATLPACAADHSAAVTLVGTLRTRLDAVRAIAAQGSALALAEHHLAEAHAAVADLTARHTDTQADTARHIAAVEQEADAAGIAVHAAETTAAATLAALRAERDAIPEPGTDQAVTLARAALATAEAAVEQAKAAIDAATAAKAQHAAAIEALRAALEQGAAVLAQTKTLEAEIADWTLLGMGLRGVIDLSIEDAGPGIAALANDLLSAAYGPRFSVRIVTQRDQANGKTVETFDISVIDAESGLESSLMQKSGGQQVFLDRCLTDAVALYQQDAAGMRYETLFSDEIDGALSEENRSHFFAMERKTLAIGGYTRKYFVSHSPSAWESADHIIDLSDFVVSNENRA
jgi:DNA repair protein SbcC/Rad50